jgi:ABC-type glycerol-3-phosphate transport system permease component
MNSLIIAIIATGLCIFVAIPAAYSFARHDYKGKNLVMVGILLCNMIPQASTLVPLYRAMDKLGLIDSYVGIAFTHLLCMLPFSIIMLKGFIKTIPKTMEEAALIDGCTKLQALFKIIVPVCSSGIFATAMYAFMISWEEFLYAMTFSTSGKARTISIGLKMFSTEFKVDWSSILAAATLMTLPILIIFFLIQDTFIKGATDGALKE